MGKRLLLTNQQCQIFNELNKMEDMDISITSNGGNGVKLAVMKYIISHKLNCLILTYRPPEWTRSISFIDYCVDCDHNPYINIEIITKDGLEFCDSIYDVFIIDDVVEDYMLEYIDLITCHKIYYNQKKYYDNDNNPIHHIKAYNNNHKIIRNNSIALLAKIDVQLIKKVISNFYHNKCPITLDKYSKVVCVNLCCGIIINYNAYQEYKALSEIYTCVNCNRKSAIVWIIYKNDILELSNMLRGKLLIWDRDLSESYSIDNIDFHSKHTIIDDSTTYNNIICSNSELHEVIMMTKRVNEKKYTIATYEDDI